MTSAFAALENAAWSAWDRVMGEEFEHRPYVPAPGGGARTADGTRAIRTLACVLEIREHRATEFGTEARGSTPATMQKTWAHMDTTQLGASPRPQRHDRLARTATGDVYEIAQVERDGEGRLKLQLKHIGKEGP